MEEQALAIPQGMCDDVDFGVEGAPIDGGIPDPLGSIAIVGEPNDGAAVEPSAGGLESGIESGSINALEAIAAPVASPR